MLRKPAEPSDHETKDNMFNQHSHHHRPDPLSPEKLQMFAATLSGLSQEEVRKAKSLYIRNAISEHRAMTESLAGFRSAQGCMSAIPIFWPIFGAQKRMMNAQLQLQRDRIQNAIDVWQDDLKGERFDLDEFPED
jgi:hypothetical protein